MKSIKVFAFFICSVQMIAQASDVCSAKLLYSKSQYNSEFTFLNDSLNYSKGCDLKVILPSVDTSFIGSRIILEFHDKNAQIILADTVYINPEIVLGKNFVQLKYSNFNAKAFSGTIAIVDVNNTILCDTSIK